MINMRKISKFKEFIGEASLRGNTGIPGEEGSGRESWLDKTNTSSDSSARAFAMGNRADIENFSRLAMRAQELHAGHENQLADLTEEAIRAIFGSMIDDITLKLKIGSKEEVAEMMEETEDSQQPELEEITDTALLDAIQVRKILRTVQQGKGLSVKEILNSEIMKSGVERILGTDAAEYIRTLNKVCSVAQFFDWTVPEEVQKGAWQARNGFAGSVKLDFPEESEEPKADAAEALLKDLEEGNDIINSPEAEELLSDINTTIEAIGIDLSVLVHETVKGIYMLTVQWSLDSLSEEDAEKVIANTDTLFDELQEIKYGRQMQNTFFKIVARNVKVIEKINELSRSSTSDDDIIAFQEQLNFIFFGKLVAISKEDPKEFLKIVNNILSENDEAVRECSSLIEDSMEDIEQEDLYQREKRGELDTRSDDYYEDDENDNEVTYPEDFPGYTGQSTEDLLKANTSKMSKDEIANAIIDAYQKGDDAEIARLRRMLPESYRFPRFNDYSKLFENLKRR
jgi:hypothetical protein